jgi:hypothetical protein
MSLRFKNIFIYINMLNLYEVLSSAVLHGTDMCGWQVPGIIHFWMCWCRVLSRSSLFGYFTTGFGMVTVVDILIVWLGFVMSNVLHLLNELCTMHYLHKAH